MKQATQMMLRQLDLIVNMAYTRLSKGFLESIYNKFQSAERKVVGFARFSPFER